jgi:SAM-dependent methyltransferase
LLDARVSLTRLNIGCGPNPVDGWLNLDRRWHQGVDLCCDLREPIPLGDASIDYAVAIHVLQDMAWGDLPRAVSEMRRVLKPDGVLRLALPDLERAIDAWRRGDSGYFYVPDEDARSIGAKLVTQIIWYGSVRTPFTFDFAAELLTNSGFRTASRCAFRQTCSAWPEIVVLDNRERESLFVEAVK